MQLKITTWNINSVRLRIDLVAKFIKAARPDILCLQETKCPDDAFPRKRLKRLGYEHVALNGQKGYHGVVVISRLPFESSLIQTFCGKSDCRHMSIVLGERAGLRDPITLHNFYVPAGGDIPDPAINPKFAHKLAFLDEMHGSATLRAAQSERCIMVGDLNVAPLECDVWSHKHFSTLSRTRRSNAKSFSAYKKPAAGSTRCGASCRSRRSSSPGGATARPIGPRLTRAAGSITFGSHRRSPNAFRPSRS
jgi:exodeoxyribonuclease III